MSYIRFGLMIATSTIVMFLLMYLNTYAWEHVFISETRVYMAALMGAAMALIMLAFMLGMYKSPYLNFAIFASSAVIFALSLWLVRSQITISGESYMRAMIPHHSIAIMTSERAQIQDSRVRKLADEIIAAQRREISEMRYLIGEASEQNLVLDIFEDPPAKNGTVDDALANLTVSRLDLAPILKEQADQLLEKDLHCTFKPTAESQPFLWASAKGDLAAVKLNGVQLRLEASEPPKDNTASFSAPGIAITIRTLGEHADWRQNADLVFRLDNGLQVGYRGFSECLAH